MRRAIVIGMLGLALTPHGAGAQTAAEQAQILRDFERSVADYTQRHQGLATFPEAVPVATVAPKVFTLPVTIVFRQLIARALIGQAGEPRMSGVGSSHRAAPLGPFPGSELYDFPTKLAAALPPLPAPLSTA